MKESFASIFDRANQLLDSGNSIAQAARKLSVEFYATAYVNAGLLWVGYTDETGKLQRRVLA